MNATGPIVVGFDCSEYSINALRYAVEQAKARSALLRVVTAYHVPRYGALPAGPPTGVTEREIAEDVLNTAKTAVDQVIAGDPNPPKVEVIAVPGPASKALLEAATEASHLVVGHRGRGGFASMLLGSVGLQCSIHAPCTVTVVR